MKLTDEQIIEKLLLGPMKWLNTYDFTDIKLNRIRNTIFKRHCNKQMTVTKLSYIRDCNEHRYICWQKIYLCNCPSCSHIDVEPELSPY